MSSQFPAHLQVVRKAQLDVIVPSGAGRLLSEGYLTGGHFIAKRVNSWAHRMGYGPEAAGQRITEQFGSQEQRLDRLNKLRIEVDLELECDCSRLMEYALP
jgi:hypothetical protein